jgi:hypothetical protein
MRHRKEEVGKLHYPKPRTVSSILPKIQGLNTRGRLEFAFEAPNGTVPSRAYNTGQNLNTGISVFLIYKTGIPVF